MAVFAMLRAGVLGLALLARLGLPGAARAQEQAAERDAYAHLREFLVGDARVRENPRAVDAPLFIPVSDAALYMDPDAEVLVEEPVREGGPVFVYPRDILVRHEVLNLQDQSGTRRSVTYSPLTGSVAGYLGAVGLHRPALGTTGQFLNMNRVLYDRSTNGLWPQILGECISGPLRGQPLARFPLLWTRWRLARARWPEAQVLSRQTGFRVSYDRDPYGSYRRDGTWYTSGDPRPPISHIDRRLGPKERVLGLAVGEAAVAFVEAAVREHGVASATAGLVALVAIHDPGLDAVRVFHAEADGRVLTFMRVGGEIFDEQTRSRWSATGRAVEGRLRGMALERAAAMDCMWFAWAAFHPGTLAWIGPGALLDTPPQSQADPGLGTLPSMMPSTAPEL